MIRAYHFVGDKLRDGRPVPPDGEWLVHDGELVMCISGLHASRHPFDALNYAPDQILCLVDCDGLVVEDDDKLVCSRRRIVARFDATDMLRAFARQCALDVIHMWDAPQVVMDYLTTGDESLRDAASDAARDAAVSAAWAAWDAARSTAGNAAWNAVWSAARSVARSTAWNAAWNAAGNAAGAAAWDAVWSTAWSSAWKTAGNAAGNAVLDAKRERFARLVADEFARIGVV